METAGKKRNAERTAEQIVFHAQSVFTEFGYDAATTREIARRADVNVALIKRYFGSKLGLFEKAIVPYLSLERFLDGPIETMGQRMADFYVETRPKESFDPFLAFLRSSSSQEAGPVLMEALKRQALEPLTGALSGDNQFARATLLATQAAGLIVQFRVLGIVPKNDEEVEALRSILRSYFDSLIRGAA